MARRRRSAPTVSLFPFLSILACVIGTLTLMITALALGQMDTPAVVNVEKYEQAKAELADNEGRSQELVAQITQTRTAADQQNSALVAMRQQLEKLSDQLRQLQNEKPTMVDIPKVDVAAHGQRLKQLRAEITRLQQLIEKLTQQVAQKDAQSKEAVVRIQPGGSGKNLNPTFVECAATRIVIHSDPPLSVRRADLAKDANLLKLLERVAKSERDTVVFLVRDDAISTYLTARNLARARYARNGKLPVIGQGKIDLSLFKNK